MTKYFTSDTHFAHPFVAALRGYAKPGFTSDSTIKQQANEAPTCRSRTASTGTSMTLT